MRSDRLLPGDCRAAFRLLGEVRERSADTDAWVRHMLAGLGRLTGASVGFGGVVVDVGGTRQRSAGVANVGWGAAAECAYREYKRHRSAEGSDPFKRYMLPRWRLVFTVDGARLFGRDARRGASEAESLKRQADVGPLLYSSSPLWSVGGTFSVTLMRPWGGRPFAERQRQVVHLFHEELARLWREEATAEAGDGRRAGLSFRLRQTLDLLRQGAGEKEVAARLGLSRHTVHDYVKALHERFAAASRGELLAAAARHERRFVPWIDAALLAPGRGGRRDRGEKGGG